jgi:hypothetical protein
MPRPSKGTPEYELWIAAIDVAIDPPLKPQRPTVQLYAPKLKALRDALEGVGIDWRKVKEANEEGKD